MQRQITIENQSIDYTLRKSKRARNLRITVRAGGTLLVSGPASIHESVFERFLREKSDWLFSKIAYFKQFPISARPRRPRRWYKKYKENARMLAKERLSYFNTFYNFSIKQVRIKRQKSRWGSCSEKGNLNFNFKIVLLPSHLADYIIVHELCHLGEFNHSRNFWNLVSKTIPDYKERRKELSQNNFRMNLQPYARLLH